MNDKKEFSYYKGQQGGTFPKIIYQTEMFFDKKKTLKTFSLQVQQYFWETMRNTNNIGVSRPNKRDPAFLITPKQKINLTFTFTKNKRGTIFTPLTSVFAPIRQIQAIKN